MATTPTPVPSTPSVPVPQTWLQKHERLLIVFLVLLAGVWGFHDYLSHQANQAQARATVAEQVLADVKTEDAKLATQATQTLQQYQTMVQALTVQNSSLAATVAQRTIVLTQQQTADKALPLPDLAKRLQVVGNIDQADISAVPGGVALTQNGALKVTSSLESIPTLTDNLADTEADLVSTQKTLSAANTAIVAQENQLVTLKAEEAAQTASCKASLAAATKRGRLQSLKWFLRGTVVGFVAGVVTVVAH